MTRWGRSALDAQHADPRGACMASQRPLHPLRIDQPLARRCRDQAVELILRLTRSEFEGIFVKNNLRILESQIAEQFRPFDHWMLVAGSKPGDRPYEEARSLLESTLAHDLADRIWKKVVPPEACKAEVG